MPEIVQMIERSKVQSYKDANQRFNLKRIDMKKRRTLFVKDPGNLSGVVNKINDGNQWVFGEDVIAAGKFDGTAHACKLRKS